MIRLIFFSSLAVIFILGTHYTGFVNLFPKNEEETLGDTSAWVSDLVPRIQTTDIKGQSVSLENFKNQMVLINFWASWCSPCLEEFPALIKTIKWAKGQVTLLAISNDSSKEDMFNFLKKQKLPTKNLHIIWDPKNLISSRFDTIKLPETFVLNQEGKIIKKYTGLLHFKELKQFLEKELKK